MKKRILFVDDEPNVINGLRRMLRNMRKTWDMEFAQCGAEALDILAEKPFDVVVSDIRMPGMDGVQLLTQVMNLYPDMVRIVLSGHMDREMILKSVRPAHQYLSKPCDAERLKSVVTQACALRELLTDKSLKEVVSKVDALPSMPCLYNSIMVELQSQEPSLKKVGDIISKDVGMTAKILQLVNSAFFGLRQNVSSPDQAVNLLGLDTIKALVLSVKIFSQFDQSDIEGLSLDALFRHGLMTGKVAKEIAKMESQVRTIIDDSFMAGILHDSGKMVLAQEFPGRYREAINMSHERNLPLWKAEQEVFGTTHSEMGAYLMGIWGLPDPIVEAIAFHHRPSGSIDTVVSPLTALHAGNVFEHEMFPLDKREIPSEIDSDYIQKLDLGDRLDHWRDECKKNLMKELGE